jgi:hypothetical protein
MGCAGICVSVRAARQGVPPCAPLHVLTHTSDHPTIHIMKHCVVLLQYQTVSAPTVPASALAPLT